MGVKILYNGGKSFSIRVGEHEILTDLPEEFGGADKGPTPTELFIGSLGACAALFAVRYLQTAQLDPEGLSAELVWDINKEKKCVEKVDILINTPKAELGARKKALQIAAGKCVIHNTLNEHPVVNIDVKGQ